ncbi:MAG: hypothetical protein QOK48_274, partial [Blastocatellia bacterium]|nr:hypothetical protein [Blastocatellia bacterium]
MVRIRGAGDMQWLGNEAVSEAR